MKQFKKTIHRIQPFELTQNVIKIAREAGIHSVNTDLIYGLPHQTKRVSKTLEKMITLDTDRFAVFNYAHVPWLYETMRKFDETTFPKPQEKLEMLKDTIDFLQQMVIKWLEWITLQNLKMSYLKQLKKVNYIEISKDIQLKVELI